MGFTWVVCRQMKASHQQVVPSDMGKFDTQTDTLKTGQVYSIAFFGTSKSCGFNGNHPKIATFEAEIQGPLNLGSELGTSLDVRSSLCERAGPAAAEGCD